MKASALPVSESVREIAAGWAAAGAELHDGACEAVHASDVKERLLLWPNRGGDDGQVTTLHKARWDTRIEVHWQQP